jgi:glycosyltransferase involved in cell wall biosynthesis
MKIKILHIITGLGNGGAERTLHKLCEEIDRNLFDLVIVSLKNEGVYGDRLRKLGIKCYFANLHGRNRVWSLIKLYKFIRDEQPDIIQTWLYHADLIGLLIAKIAGVNNIIWNIRSTKLNFKDSSWHLVIVRKFCAILSFLPQKIIACSQTSIDEHIRVGYQKDKFVHIPNGYDLGNLYSNPELSLIKSEKLKIGIVGRNNPLKDFLNFFSAVKIIANENLASQIAVIVVGRGVEDNYKMFTNTLAPIELSFWGECDNMLAVYNSFDFLVLSSKSEAFPNVIAEAMSCGKPCVSTDVGDARIIIGDTGFVVPSSNPKELAAGIRKMISLGKAHISELGQKARQRIEENYSLSTMVDKYENLYNEMMNL